MRPLHYKDLSACGQALYVLCALVIFSYILFDVLDVDGSDLTKVFNSGHRSSIGAFVPAEIEFDFGAKHDALALGAVLIVSVRLIRSAATWLAAFPVSAWFKTRSHGSLLALARNSHPDSIPDH